VKGASERRKTLLQANEVATLTPDPIYFVGKLMDLIQVTYNLSNRNESSYPHKHMETFETTGLNFTSKVYLLTTFPNVFLNMAENHKVVS
jgi:hypothetical protein